jgi:hypothetical protein
MKVLANVIYWVVAVVCVGLGVLGVFAPALERDLLLGLSFDKLRVVEGNDLAVLLSEHRAAAAYKAGFGALLIAARREVFGVRRVNAIFLVTLAFLPIARLASLVLDGLPNVPIVLLMLGQALLAAFFGVYFFGALWSKRAQAELTKNAEGALGAPSASSASSSNAPSASATAPAPAKKVSG